MQKVIFNFTSLRPGLNSGLRNELQRVAGPHQIDVTNTPIHRPATTSEINLLPDSFWVGIANQHQVEGFVLHAELLVETFEITEDPTLGSERLARSIDGLRYTPPPIIVVLFQETIQQSQEQYPDLIRALRGRAHLVECKGKGTRRLAREIMRFFIRPRPY